MKRFIRPLSLAVAAGVTVIGMSLALSAWAQNTTVNCYNYSNNPDCGANSNCIPASTSGFYCKQLSIPYSDPGCCKYFRVDTTWSDSGATPHCACAGTTTTSISLANNSPDHVCMSGSDTSTTQAPNNTDVQGHCGTPAVGGSGPDP